MFCILIAVKSLVKAKPLLTITMKKYRSEITGHLDIIVADNEDEFEGEIQKWQDVLIHGDPEGLRSFAKLLVKIADLNQDNIAGPSDWRKGTYTSAAKFRHR
jgi:hypothetical protein